MPEIPPGWLEVIEEYRSLLEPTASGDSTEELLMDETPYQTNAVRALVASGKKHEVCLLMNLKAKGLLRPLTPSPPHPVTPSSPT